MRFFPSPIALNMPLVNKHGIHPFFPIFHIWQPCLEFIDEPTPDADIFYMIDISVDSINIMLLYVHIDDLAYIQTSMDTSQRAMKCL